MFFNYRSSMESNPQPSGICQRLFRLMFGPLRSASALPAPPTRPIKVEDSEIAVEFNHNLRDKDGLILSDKQRKHAQDGVGKRERDKEHKGKKSVSFKGSERKEEEAAATTVAGDDQDETKARRHWPLLNVASNINEKSEAFIERKKKAMGRNYSLDQDRIK